MTRQRFCNLDGLPIDDAAERFYTVTDSATGLSKDICVGCARKASSVVVWAPLQAYAAGARVRPTSGQQGVFVYDCIVPGTSGETEPAWPVGKAGQVVNDGNVTWQMNKAPKDNSALKIRKTNVTADESMHGWMQRDDA